MVLLKLLSNLMLHVPTTVKLGYTFMPQVFGENIFSDIYNILSTGSYTYDGLNVGDCYRNFQIEVEHISENSVEYVGLDTSTVIVDCYDDPTSSWITNTYYDVEFTGTCCNTGTTLYLDEDEKCITSSYQFY